MDLLAKIHGFNPYLEFDDSKFAFEENYWGFDTGTCRELIANSKPDLIIEVGSWYGISAIEMGKIVESLGLKSKILCIDTWLGSIEQLDNRDILKCKNGYPQFYYQFLANVIKNGMQNTIIPFPTTSITAYRWLKAHGVMAELIYIDGSHEEDDVYLDVKYFSSLLTTNGVIWGDDWNSRAGVKRAVTRYTEETGHRIDAVGRSWILTGQGRRKRNFSTKAKTMLSNIVNLPHHR